MREGAAGGGPSSLAQAPAAAPRPPIGALSRARSASASLEVCALLLREGLQHADPDLRYVGFRIPDDFIVGYGLDVGERYRNLPHLCAYVGPDGKPAAHAPGNVPYRPKHWLKIADKPLREGDFVMAAGYPGRTSRYALAGEFEDTEQWGYPTTSRHYRALIALVEARGKADPDIEVKYASTVRGWERLPVLV